MNKKLKSVEVLITAYHEEPTIGPLIQKVEVQLNNLLNTKRISWGQIILATPDKETREIGLAASKYGLVKPVEVPVGRPKAFDEVLPTLKADVVIFTDGDLIWSDYVIEPILEVLESSDVAAAGGHLVPTNSKDTMLGYWAWVTSQAGAHIERLKAFSENRFVNLPGGIFGIKRDYIPERVPHEILGDDLYFTYMVYKNKGRVGYAPEAVVYVKYPTKLKDWINQKKRTAGAEYQIRTFFKDYEDFKPMRSFWKEARYLPAVLKYASNFRELLWSILLILFRTYVWAAAFIEQKILRRNPYEIWVRVESSKISEDEISNS